MRLYAVADVVDFDRVTDDWLSDRNFVRFVCEVIIAQYEQVKLHAYDNTLDKTGVRHSMKILEMIWVGDPPLRLFSQGAVVHAWIRVRDIVQREFQNVVNDALTATLSAIRDSVQEAQSLDKYSFEKALGHVLEYSALTLNQLRDHEAEWRMQDLLRGRQLAPTRFVEIRGCFGYLWQIGEFESAKELLEAEFTVPNAP